eukprot:6970847-Lingulodinium_polyedra.AAC.1
MVRGDQTDHDERTNASAVHDFVVRTHSERGASVVYEKGPRGQTETQFVSSNHASAKAGQPYGKG